MKKVLLFIVLGLFATSCLEEGWDTPIGPQSGTACEADLCDKWECPTTGYIYGDEDFCEQRCGEECIDH